MDENFEELVFPQNKNNEYALNGSLLKVGPLLGGLSKRELFAALAMAGDLSKNTPTEESMDRHAKGWIAAADALALQLEDE